MAALRTYLFRRLLGLVPLLFLVAVISWVLVRLTPGDPASLVLGDNATAEELARVRRVMGLDGPVWAQFARWLGRVFLHADLGQSLTLQKPVAEVILQRVEPTALLTLFGSLISIGMGVPLGVAAAVRHNSWIDRLLMAVALLGLSVPSFWLGLNLIIVFSLWWKLLPSAGYLPLAEGGLGGLRYLVLPAFAVGFSGAALIARMTRSSMLDVLGQEYVRTARAKGLPDRVVIYRHALRNAMIPTLTVVGLTVAGLAGGAVVVEIVFNISGAGRLMVNSVARRDYPVIQGAILITALLYVFVNLAVDLVYSAVDPRVRYE